MLRILSALPSLPATFIAAFVYISAAKQFPIPGVYLANIYQCVDSSPAFMGMRSDLF